MEYFLVRAMMIGTCKNDEERLKKLQEKEKSINRGLMPSEYCSCFKEKPLKQYFGIDDDDESLGRYSRKLEEEFFTKNLANSSLSSINLEKLHEYDWKIFYLLDNLDLYAQAKRSKLKDLLKSIPFILLLTRGLI